MKEVWLPLLPLALLPPSIQPRRGLESAASQQHQPGSYPPGFCRPRCGYKKQDFMGIPLICRR